MDFLQVQASFFDLKFYNDFLKFFFVGKGIYQLLEDIIYVIWC